MYVPTVNAMPAISIRAATTYTVSSTHVDDMRQSCVCHRQLTERRADCVPGARDRSTQGAVLALTAQFSDVSRRRH
jgi:hypothetical protein